MSTTNQINIIDGYNGGVAHIEAGMIRDHNISLYGTGDYVLNVGNKFAHEIVNNNNITIKDGMAVMGGARVSIGYGKTRTAVIENGTSGYKRHDLIVLEYNLDNATLIETAELKVIKGELGTSGVDPDLVTGDIRAGATVHQMALKRVKLDGLNIEAVEDIWTAASLSIIGGGTGANTAEEARQNLGVTLDGLTTIQTVEVTIGTLSANAYKDVITSAPTVSGYKPIAISYYGSNSLYAHPVSFGITPDGEIRAYVRNTVSNPINSLYIFMGIVYIKNEF